MTRDGYRAALASAGVIHNDVYRAVTGRGAQGAHFVWTSTSAWISHKNSLRRVLLQIRCDNREERFRPTRRARAADCWAKQGGRPLAVETSADALDEMGLCWLSDWLLRATPEALNRISSYVAADALAQGITQPWDDMISAGIASLDIADRLYEKWSTYSGYEWHPERVDLIP